ncbi:GmrSD restriction endonuclease domain-containing protein [Candidatus Solincola sp.]
MPTLTTFDSTKESLSAILQEISEGNIQLPDFQRGWVWDDDHIKSLLASVALSYPIGAVMMMQTGNEDVHFKPRPLEGVELNGAVEPERLILDGQQRLTSLFLALYTQKPVVTTDDRKKPIKRWYYLDMKRALDRPADMEEAVISLPDDRKVRDFRGEVKMDYSDIEKEFEHSLFPLYRIFDYTDWRHGYNKYWNYDQEKLKFFDEFEKEIIKRFEQYQIPVIVMRKETPKEAVCQVFEKVNTGGVELTVFELLTATYAAYNFNLREDWEGRWRELRKHEVLSSMRNDDFLQTVTLLATFKRRKLNGTEPERAPAISCKRKDILRLSLEEYLEWADKAQNGYIKAAKFINKQKIFSAQDLPYQTQLIPLAAILALAGEQAESDSAQNKIARWYWCGVFGELYGSAIETRFAKDLPEVIEWINGGEEPTTVKEANFMPSRLLTLRTRNSAAYKGLYALLLRDGCLEFRTGEPIDLQMYFDERIDIHHIFPRAWCEKNGIDRRKYDSIVNKTAIAAKTNRLIGGYPPSAYLEKLQRNNNISEARMDKILQTHVIDPVELRKNDFDAFFQKRMDALLSRIERAMGKSVAKDMEIIVEEPDYQDDLEE